MAPLALWTQRFTFGATAAVRGSLRALTEPTLRAVFWRNAQKLFLWSVVLLIIINALFLPVEWILSLVLPQSWIDLTIRGFRYALNGSLPFILVGACRLLTVDMFESAFFAGLSTRDPDLAKRIQRREAIYWDWEYVQHAILFGLRQAAFGLLIVIVSPIIGVLVPLLRFGYKIRQMEMVFWAPVVIAFCFRATRPSALHIVGVWMNARSLTRELYDPILARRKSAAANLQTTDTVAEWHTGRSDAARLGFAMVIGMMLQIPFIGPFMWFPAFVASGLFTKELVNVDTFRESSTAIRSTTATAESTYPQPSKSSMNRAPSSSAHIVGTPA